jgi:hypothetical protein
MLYDVFGNRHVDIGIVKRINEVPAIDVDRPPAINRKSKMQQNQRKPQTPEPSAPPFGLFRNNFRVHPGVPALHKHQQ